MTTLNELHHAIRAFTPPHPDTVPRRCYMHPDDWHRLTIDPRTARYPGPTWQGTTINALFGIDVIRDPNRPRGTFRVTDEHGCLISDSRSPA